MLAISAELLELYSKYIKKKKSKKAAVKSYLKRQTTVQLQHMGLCHSTFIMPCFPIAFNSCGFVTTSLNYSFHLLLEVHACNIKSAEYHCIKL